MLIIVVLLYIGNTLVIIITIAEVVLSIYYMLGTVLGTVPYYLIELTGSIIFMTLLGRNPEPQRDKQMYPKLLASLEV